MSPINPSLPSAAPSFRSGRQLPGVYVGVVLGGGDPAGQGRLNVSLPALGIGPVWARACVSAGGRTGGKVVVAFEGGDASYPIVLGFLA